MSQYTTMFSFASSKELTAHWSQRVLTAKGYPHHEMFQDLCSKADKGK